MPGRPSGRRRAQRRDLTIIPWGNLLIFRHSSGYGRLATALLITGPRRFRCADSTRRVKGGLKPAGSKGTQCERRTTPQQRKRNGRKMKRLFAVIMSVAVFGALAPTVDAQSACPEVEQAKEMFSKVAKAQNVQAPRTLAGARQDQQAPRSQDVQAPRSLAGARSQDVQAPRGQETQAPRGQDVQAPRGQDVAAARGQETQAPRGQDTQAPRGQDVQAPRGQDTQAPRGQDVQAPRSGQSAGQAIQAPHSSDAAKLIREAEAACKAGKMAEAKAKAQAAMKMLK